MIISSRYNRGDQVFFISSGEIYQAEIISIGIYDSIHGTNVYSDVKFTIDDKEAVAQVKEEYLFDTVDELMKTTFSRYIKKVIS